MPKPDETTSQTPQTPQTQLQAQPEVEETEEGVYFVIGGEKVLVPPLYFWSVKRSWDDIGLASVAPDPVTRIESLLKVIESSLANSDNPVSYEQLSRKLRTSEWRGLTAAYPYLLVQSGFITREDLERRQKEEAESQRLGEEEQGQVQRRESEGASASSNRSSSGPASEDPSRINDTGIRTVKGTTSIQ